MPTHPVTGPQTCHGKPLPDEQRVRKSASMYALVAEELRGSITPFVCSTDCVVHVEYAAFQRHVASRLAVKWHRPYSQVMSWVRLKS